MKKTFRLIVFAACAAAAARARAQETAVTDAEPAETAESAPARTVAELRKENDALRRENQELRRQLVARRRGRARDNTPLPVVETNEPAEPKQVTEPDTGYWLSNSSHVRHNRKCRNYQKVRGRPCGPDEGRACKACGG